MKKCVLIISISMVCLNLKVIAHLKHNISNNTQTIIANAHTQDSLEGAIKEYLKWYRANRTRLEKFQLVSGTPGDSTRPYKVNFEQTDLYVKELNKSGLVSEEYINNYKQYFKTCNENLRKNPQYDGPADGFGIDLVLQTQEPEEILDNIDELKVISKIHGNLGLASIPVSKYMKLQISLSRLHERWQINSLKFIPSH